MLTSLLLLALSATPAEPAPAAAPTSATARVPHAEIFWARLTHNQSDIVRPGEEIRLIARARAFGQCPAGSIDCTVGIMTSVGDCATVVEPWPGLLFIGGTAATIRETFVAAPVTEITPCVFSLWPESDEARVKTVLVWIEP